MRTLIAHILRLAASPQLRPYEQHLLRLIIAGLGSYIGVTHA